MVSRLETEVLPNILIYSNIVYLVSVLLVPHYYLPMTVGKFLIDLSFIGKDLYTNKRMVQNKSILLLLGFILVNVLSLLSNQARIPGANSFILFLTIMVVNLYVSIISNNWSAKMWRFFYMTMIVHLLSGIFQLISKDALANLNVNFQSDFYFDSYQKYSNLGILVGFGHNPSVIGIVVSVAIILLYFTLDKNDKLTTFLIKIAGLLFLFYLLVLTGKRTFLLFLPLIIGYYITKQVKSAKLKTYLFLSLGIVVSIFIFGTEPGQSLIDRTLNADLLTGRGPTYRLMWSNFLENPLLGKGLFHTKLVSNLNHGHNLVLQLLSESGLLGFFVFTSFLINNLINTEYVARNVDKNMAKKYYAIQAIQLMFITYSFFENPFYDLYPFIMYIYVVGLVQHKYQRLYAPKMLFH